LRLGLKSGPGGGGGARHTTETQKEAGVGEQAGRTRDLGQGAESGKRSYCTGRGATERKRGRNLEKKKNKLMLLEKEMENGRERPITEMFVKKDRPT